jgi:hypothetical protein
VIAKSISPRASRITWKHTSISDDDKIWIIEQLAATNAKIERVETTLLTEFHTAKRSAPRQQRAGPLS